MQLSDSHVVVVIYEKNVREPSDNSARPSTLRYGNEYRCRAREEAIPAHIRVTLSLILRVNLASPKKVSWARFRANSIPTMPVPACYSRQLQHSASTPNSALSYSLFSLVTPLPAPHELFQSDDRLCPEIWAAIRALPLSQLLAALEQGQSVFRRAPSQSVASFPIFGRGTVSYKPFTRVNPQSIPDSQRVSFRPLLKIPLFTTPTVIPYQPPTS